MSEIQELMDNPLVQELVEQNRILSENVPETQHLALTKKINLDKISIPHTIKHRLLFKEGMHNELFYPYEEMAKDVGLWDNCGIFLAEHEDASPAFVGLSKNPKLNPTERAIYGDIELVDKSIAQKLEYQILTKNAFMGLSPTIDVNKQMVDGKMCAMGPYKLKSQSIVLDPAVRETMFNSNNKTTGGASTMGEGNDAGSEKLGKDEVSIKKDELEKLKENAKALDVYKKAELSKSVEDLAKLEVTIGKCTEENLAARKLELEKLSIEERKAMKGAYDWVATELSDKSEEDLFIESLPEELRGKIPPGLRKFIDEKKMAAAKIGAEDNALSPEEKLKKEEEEKRQNMIHKGGKDDKKYPYPEKSSQRINEKGDTQTLSRGEQNLVNPTERNTFNPHQELSQETVDSNQEFLGFLQNAHGGRR